LAAQVLAHPAQLVASALNSDPLMAQQLIEEFQREVVRGRGLAAYERLMRIVDASSGALASMLTAERMANGMSSENVAIGAVGAVSDAFSDSDADDERSGERAAIINTALLRLSRLAGESSRTGLGSEQG
jgi:hypothetical protein